MTGPSPPSSSRHVEGDVGGQGGLEGGDAQNEEPEGEDGGEDVHFRHVFDHPGIGVRGS